jgi:hypothetical protein
MLSSPITYICYSGTLIIRGQRVAAVLMICYTVLI